MYSKERGITHDGGLAPPTRQPAYRQPSRPRMQVPPNYSGHAIVDGEERPLGQMPEPEVTVETPAPDGPTPRFDDLPRVSDLGDARRPRVRTVSATFEEPDEMDVLPEESASLRETAPTPPPTGPASAAPSAPSAPTPPVRPSLFDLSRFPFGHGIGFEELLILGLILFLLHESGECEDRGDIDETVILLGLLLLLG